MFQPCVPQLAELLTLCCRCAGKVSPAKAHNIKGILCDYAMRGGGRAQRQVRTPLAFPEVPVLLLTLFWYRLSTKTFRQLTGKVSPLFTKTAPNTGADQTMLIGARMISTQR